MGVYGDVAKQFAAAGYTFVGYDLRGHGRSQGERGYLDDYGLITKETLAFIECVFKMYPNQPKFLMGHGLGGMFALTYSKQFKHLKFSGLIMACCGLKKPARSKFLLAVSDIALKLMPNRAGLVSLDFRNLCSNPNAS